MQGAFEYTRGVLYKLKTKALRIISELGGHKGLVALIEKLDKQIDAASTPKSKPATPPPALTPAQRAEAIASGPRDARIPPPVGVGVGAATEGGTASSFDRERQSSVGRQASSSRQFRLGVPATPSTQSPATAPDVL